MPIELQHPRCPFCHEQVLPAQRKAPCHACMAWHHEACWTEHGGCSACGDRSVALTPLGAAPGAAGTSEPLTRPVPSAELGAWLTRHCRGSEVVLVRAVHAAAVRALPDGVPERGALSLVATWLACPCAEHVRDAREGAALARQIALDAPSVAESRYATLASVALRAPSMRLDVQGVAPFAHALEVASAALAARRGASRAQDEDRLAIQTVAARAMAWDDAR